MLEGGLGYAKGGVLALFSDPPRAHYLVLGGKLAYAVDEVSQLGYAELVPGEVGAGEELKPCYSMVAHQTAGRQVPVTLALSLT